MTSIITKYFNTYLTTKYLYRASQAKLFARNKKIHFVEKQISDSHEIRDYGEWFIKTHNLTLRLVSGSGSNLDRWNETSIVALNSIRIHVLKIIINEITLNIQI